MLSQILSGRMSPTEIVALLIALVLGISVHEFSHAAAATWLGDKLPGREGRLTLAPAAHLDVMGSLMFLVGGFGWGKPVRYNPYALRTDPRTGGAIVAAAGPISNILLAALFAIPVRLMVLLADGRRISTGPEGILLELLIGIVFYNLLLGIFNLIPIAPLDGFSILFGILPPSLAYPFEQTRQWGIFLLLALLLLSGYVPLIGSILYGPVDALTQLFTGF